jgi:hypothetical protein
MRTTFAAGLVACGALLAGACTDTGIPTGVTAAELAGGFGNAVGAGRLTVYAGGENRSRPQQPCLKRPEHRQFDFWLGEWDVTNAAGDPAGTNVVTSELDGCLIQEHWTGVFGGRGRSLNAYDSDTGTWHQTWVAASDIGHLRMSGGLDGAVMTMAGVRTQPNGVQWFDDYTWTPIDPDQLVQAGRLRIPVAGIDIAFALTYTRADAVVPAPEAPTTNCEAGGRSDAARQLDFWHGSWRVLRANGKQLGVAEIGRDLSGCLTEESFRSAKGYASISFAYFDLVESRWYRTTIDSEAERVELRGDVDGGPLVMTGTEPGPGGREQLVRVTITPVSADEVHQLWEVSGDDGVRWHEAVRLVYVRM